jgi:radical SAM superfamily enzyme YgiQ (UPF0313 family)
MRIGIIDIVSETLLGGRMGRIYGTYFRRQFMSIMPQAVAVWCRALGHDVHYATYWGQVDPLSLVPGDADVVFVLSYTQSSALAYGLAAALKRRGALTVLGGPHARSFPTDCARFFDIVVKDCDRTLIDDILRRRFDPPAIVSSGRPLTEFPSVEERMPEIRTAAFRRGRPVLTSIVPLLSSIGCPYTCGFCVDWNSQYVALSADRLQQDLEYLSRYYPKLVIAYHDPNFAVRFDETMDVIARVPEGRRNHYIMETSLSILKEARMLRLTETRCVYVAPGIESWIDYSNKAGAGARKGREKLEKVVTQLETLSRHVPGIQANFLFGSDTDEGEEPVALTKEFIRRLPQVWPTINIPTPYGGTPLYDELYREGRILESMPFAFYSNPYLAITLKHYDPATYYDHFIDMHEVLSSNAMLLRRLRTKVHFGVRFVHTLRTLETRVDLARYHRIRAMLRSDAQFRAFHEGRSSELPAFYTRLLEKRLGRYAELLPAEARRPVLEPPPPPAEVAGSRAAKVAA